MKTIPLTQGKVAIVDDADYDMLIVRKWCAHRVRSKNTEQWYAVSGGGKAQVSMHRVLMNAPKGAQIDHANGNGLDNRRCNLRISTHAENQENRRSFRGSSRFKGVHWSRTRRKWYAMIGWKGKIHHLGSFPEEEEAAIAYDVAAQVLHGPFARCNHQGGAKRMPVTEVAPAA